MWLLSIRKRIQSSFTHACCFTSVNIATKITQICIQEEESSSARSGELDRIGTGFCEFANEYFGSLEVRSFLVDFLRNTCTVEWANELGLDTYTINFVFFPFTE